MTGSMHLPIISELKQSMENSELIFCPRTLIVGTEDCLLFAGLFSGIYTSLIFSKVYLQMLQTENLSFMQFIILTSAQGQASLNRLLLIGFETTGLKKKKKKSFIIQIHFSDGSWSFPLALYSHLFLAWNTYCRGCKKSTWAVLL